MNERIHIPHTVGINYIDYFDSSPNQMSTFSTLCVTTLEVVLTHAYASLS